MWKGFFKNEFLGCSGWRVVGFGWCKWIVLIVISNEVRGEILCYVHGCNLSRRRSLTIVRDANEYLSRAIF